MGFRRPPGRLGAVDDAQSTAALRAAYDGGVRLFDTADVYGAGHAERVLGAAVAPFRDEVVITTKVGLVFDEVARDGAGHDLTAAHIRRACEDSLRRLGTDRIDIYQIHPGDAGPPEVAVAAFEELLAKGKIRAYGTSATDPDHIAAVCSAPTSPRSPHATSSTSRCSPAARSRWACSRASTPRRRS